MTVYEELGVRPFINALANHTRYGGSIMPDAVVRTMVEAAKHYVDVNELQRAAGKAIASMTGNEACYISCGAASGLQLAIASCIVGTNEEKAQRLQDSGRQANVIMLRPHLGTEADVAVRNTGARLRAVGDGEGVTTDQISSGIDDNTAAIVIQNWESSRVPGIEHIIKLSHEHSVPVIVDAADGVPPKENFRKYTRELGADAVVVSGGKRLRGPQNTGLVLGWHEIIEGCIFLGNPNARFGRTMKVSKEAMAGIYMAVKCFMEDESVSEAAYKRARYIADHLSRLKNVSIDYEGTEVNIRILSTKLTDEEIVSKLKAGNPAILAFCRNSVLRLNTWPLQPGEERIVAKRIVEVLS